MVTIAASVIAVSAQHLRRDPLSRFEGTLADENEAWVQLWHENKLDHFDPNNTRTYRQRYWEFNEADDGEGPVFLYICGEWTCSPPSIRSNHFAIGTKLRAKLYVLEHRYYGDSQPFRDDEGGWTEENFWWLTSRQALADTAHFIDHQNDLMDGSKRKWVIIGGSYPGALSAWFKSKYPGHVEVAWSSSGVIHVIDDYEKYDFTILETSNHSNPDCAKEIFYLTQTIHHLFDHGSAEERRQLFEVFRNDLPDISEFDFMMFIADTFAGKVQGGRRVEMCETLASADFKADPITGLANMTLGEGLTTAAYADSALRNTTVDMWKNMRQWSYQYCTEFGFFQTPNEVLPLRADVLRAENWPGFCERMFSEHLPKLDVNKTNEYYGGLDIQGEKIIFMTASEDPWQYAGMRHIHDPATQSKMRAIHIECDTCSHCVDLGATTSTSPQALQDAYVEIEEQLREWLGYTDSQETQFLQ